MSCSHSLRKTIKVLRKEKELVEISTPVNMHLEMAEIHRRVIAQQGPALLFNPIGQTEFQVISNLFGTKRRIELIFGEKPREILNFIPRLMEEFSGISSLWREKKNVASTILSLMPHKKNPAFFERDIDLRKIPFQTSWPKDGGAFLTLCPTHTVVPQQGPQNIGLYRIQRFGKTRLALHCQIGKGASFHRKKAMESSHPLPLAIALGAPPISILAAIAPIPENVPEHVFAMLMAGRKLTFTTGDFPAPLFAEAEGYIFSKIRPDQNIPEGPFGDHYGYYSWQHEFPLVEVSKLLLRTTPILPATVVGKPYQEDFYLGNYLQEMFLPMMKLLIPNLVDFWSYGEAGFHTLACASVRQRYAREALSTGFRLLGEGQLSLTKFLLIADKTAPRRKFSLLLPHLLERISIPEDIYIFGKTSMDTLDYTGTALNKGSKALIVGMGEAKRSLPKEILGPLPSNCTNAKVFCPGCLVVTLKKEEKTQNFIPPTGWPLVVIANDIDIAHSDADFIWNVFTRSAPEQDLSIKNGQIILDAQIRNSYPEEVIADKTTIKLVDKKWKKYGLSRS